MLQQLYTVGLRLIYCAMRDFFSFLSAMLQKVFSPTIWTQATQFQLKKRQLQWLKLKCCKPKYLSAAVHAPVHVLFGLLPTTKVIKNDRRCLVLSEAVFFCFCLFFQWEADSLGLSWMCLSILLFIHPWAKKLPGNKQYWLVTVVCWLCNYTGKWQCVVCLLLLHPPLPKKII